MSIAAAVGALILAATLVIAAVAKLRDRAGTEADFESLGLPNPRFWAGAVPIAELATAAALIVVPGWGGVAAFGLLAAFTANLVMVIRSGRVASCACFGGSSTEPVSSKHLVRNAALLVLALLAATIDGRLWG
ncbi:MAG: DoxX family protein [Acidimicrobiales bacterium]